MSTRRFALVAFLLFAVASVWAKDFPLRMKVVSAESREFQAPVLTPPDCNWKDLSGYCYSSSPQTYTENTMVVEGPDGKSLRIACTAEKQQSRCRNLPVNQSFEARRGNGVIEIRYRDQHGKLRKQVYQILGER